MDQDLDELLSEVCIPIQTKLFVSFVLLNECGFSMLLYESQQYPRGPFLRMKIIEFWGSFGLWLIDVVVIVWICQIDNHCDKVHPVKSELLDFIIDFVMNCLPQELGHQVHEF